MLVIKEVSIVDLFAYKEFPKLVEMYIKESTYGRLLKFDVQLENYMPLHNSGKFKVFAAEMNGHLIGFINLILAVLPHHNNFLATVESFYVDKFFRHTGAGLKLKATAEKYAQEAGVKGIIYSAPLDSILEKILETDCEFISKTFYKRLND